MSLINIKNLTFGYDGSFDNVFENVNIRLDTAWRLGVVGRNGRGKTTLLKLLAGEYSFRGNISASVKFTYFPFAVKDKSRPTCEVLSGICNDTEEWRILRELSYLDIDLNLYYRPFACLSNGEQTKILLAALFSGDNRFLLIDEPTNHLDANGRAVVAEYLRGKSGFMLVSHDRDFLDGCVDHILAINKTDIELQNGNFSSWFENFESRQAAEEAQSERLKKDIARLTEASRRTEAWADKAEAAKFGGKNQSGLRPDRGYAGHKAAKMMKSAKVTAARQKQAAEEKSQLLRNTEACERLKLFPLEYRNERLLTAKEVEIIYDGLKICKPVSFEIMRGDRAALAGKNGCGKSSFLKLITGEKIGHTGVFTFSSELIISYIPQTTDFLVGRLCDFAKSSGIDESLFMAILSKTGMDKSHFERDMASFSEGQKKKVLIAKSLCESAHLYVWDEPLNYIDLYSRIQIEKLLAEFKPTMIFVEHDKAFSEAVANKTIEI